MPLVRIPTCKVEHR